MALEEEAALLLRRVHRQVAPRHHAVHARLHGAAPADLRPRGDPQDPQEHLCLDQCGAGEKISTPDRSRAGSTRVACFSQELRLLPRHIWAWRALPRTTGRGGRSRYRSGSGARLLGRIQATSWRRLGRRIRQDPVYPKAKSYVAVPLDGVWSNAPYLHNGSVPTMWDLLTPMLGRRSGGGLMPSTTPNKLGLEITASREASQQRREPGAETALLPDEPARPRQPRTSLSTSGPLGPRKACLIEYLKTL